MRFLLKGWIRFLIGVLLSLSLVIGSSRAVFTASPESVSHSSSLVPQAQRQYDRGNYTQALNLLYRAQQQYRDRPLQYAQVLALTSLTQQQLGQWQPARENTTRSFELLERLESSRGKTQALAQVWNTQGHYSLATGQHKQALADWKQAEQLYRELGDAAGISGTLLAQAQALAKLGYYARSCDRVLLVLAQSQRCQSLTRAEVNSLLESTLSAKSWRIDAWNSLGNGLLLLGKFELAQNILEAADRSIPDPASQAKAKSILSLGNVHRAISLRAKAQKLNSYELHRRQAAAYFQQLANSSAPAFGNYRSMAQLNLLSLSIANERWLAAKKSIRQIKLRRNQLTEKVKFARSLALVKQHTDLDYTWQDIAELYLQAIAEARSVNAHRLESYGLGYLADLQQKWDLALSDTPEQLYREALTQAQQDRALEIAYRWQWQLGRIYRQQGDRERAIAFYQASLANLQDLRSDLAVLETEVQFDFKEQIEPVYRELADLLLTEPTTDKDLAEALQTIEALQVAELDDYFQDACLTYEPRSIAQLDPEAAVIYTIILPDRLEVIVVTSDRQHNSSPIYYHHAQAVSQGELEQTIRQLRQYITEPDRTKQVQGIANKIYGWLLKPIEAELKSQSPKTLVFVLDGMLQTIPMSALYDGSQYLIEQYAIALTPGLRLLNPRSSSSSASLVAGGISKFLQLKERSFSALSGVSDELNYFNPATSKVLLDEEFTDDNLLQQLNSTSASRLHLATHGQFNSDPQQSFLLLWQKLLTIDEFSALLYDRIKALVNPLDLLVLSACDTATGDRRSALGLAGIAVRTSSLTTIATLWQVQDDSTAELMKYFYQELEKNGKAEALRQAQLRLWQISAKDWQVPSFWAGYVAIGNWQ